MLFNTAILFFALLASSAEAFSGGAGACLAGEASVAGPGHLRDGAQVLTFADQEFELVVNDTPVTADTEVTDGFSYTIGVRAVGDTQFKGALIRADGMGVFEAGENSQVSSQCGGESSGVTHTSADLKQTLSGSFMIMGQGTITFDVTIVEANAAESIYSYEQFQITAVPPPDDTPTDMAPMDAPTDMAPTDAPVMAPMDAPVMAPAMEAPVTDDTKSSAMVPGLAVVAMVALVSFVF